MTDTSNETIIQSILEDLGSDVGNTTRGYVHASCPLAPIRHEGGVDRHPSFGVVYNSGEAKREVGHAHCFSCGYSGDIRDIAAKLHVWGNVDQDTFADIMGRAEKLTQGHLPLSLSSHTLDDPFPPSEWLYSFPKVSSMSPDAVTYLNQRGITGDMVKHFDIRYDAQRYRVSIPLYDRAQRFRGLIGRTLIKEPMGPRYFYYPYKGDAPRGFTWCNENHIDTSKPVVIVEGIFDAMKVWPVWPNVVAALSVSFRRPAMEWHHQVKRWVTMFDLGKGGALARERTTEYLALKGSKVWHLDPPEGRSDPGEATPDEIKKRLDEVVGKTPITV